MANHIPTPSHPPATSSTTSPTTTPDPIERIEWRDADGLHANDWNPNVVFDRELDLLEHSIVANGWIQPVLISKDGMVIDGFHRWQLSKTSQKLREKYDGKCPCVVLDITEADAMLLTVRINRAKGTHQATRMAALVKRLVDQHGMAREDIATGIGAVPGEVDLLYQDSLFKARNLKDYKFSKAWEPVET
jgi:hypothetical protein